MLDIVKQVSLIQAIIGTLKYPSRYLVLCSATFRLILACWGNFAALTDLGDLLTDPLARWCDLVLDAGPSTKRVDHLL